MIITCILTVARETLNYIRKGHASVVHNASIIFRTPLVLFLGVLFQAVVLWFLLLTMIVFLSEPPSSTPKLR